MLIDSRQLDHGHVVDTDVVVVGGGPAGITLALELAGSGRGVALLESGGLDPEVSQQRLNEGTIEGLPAPPLASSRLRYLGGTSGHWTGQCGPLDPIDFQKRDWVPNSGWPFGRADLDPFYARAAPYCELGPPWGFDARSMLEILDYPSLGLDEGLFEPLVYQTSPPTRFGSVWRPELEAARDVEVYLYANAVEVEVAEGGQAVRGVRCGVEEGREILVRGNVYVLAAGGIENPRILLSSRSVWAQGIGNDRDLVGRYFMDHYNVQGSGRVVFGEPTTVDSRFIDYWRHEGWTGHGGYRIPDHRLRSERLLNAAILLYPVPVNPAFRGGERTEGVEAFTELVRSVAAREMPSDVLDNSCAVVRDRRSVVKFVADRIRRTSGDRGGTLEASLQVEAEPIPNPESRVTLTREVDRFGVPRVSLDWRSSPQDLDSIRRTLSSFGSAIGMAGLGRHQVEFSLEDGVPRLDSTYHHMGTTRMGTDPATSVVDPDCRVHGVQNLYVAGSSVFPTVGRSNPTFTLVALAIRLADHLRAEV